MRIATAAKMVAHFTIDSRSRSWVSSTLQAPVFHALWNSSTLQKKSNSSRTEGLVCVLSVVEPCRTFSLVWNGRSPYVQSSQRKCLQLYYYFMDRDLGLIHVKLQTWFPFRIQVYVNGHQWLARQLDHHNVKYIKVDNAFLHLGDVVRAQELADGFERIDWIHVLDRYAVRPRAWAIMRLAGHAGSRGARSPRFSRPTGEWFIAPSGELCDLLGALEPRLPS
jgi:hypothetical protein